jgi:cytidylate kinase
MAVITISGNLGSYAREIGQLVTRELEFDYLDRAILTEAARALGVPERAIAGRDDGAPPPTLRERIASFFQDFLEHSAVAGAADPMSAVTGLESLMATTYREAAALPGAGETELNDRRYKEAITSLMTEVAAKGNVVIIGRGSQSILRDRADALHVAVTAPLAVRVQRVAERDGVPAAKAREYVEESDRGRADYHHKYFKIDPTDPNLYDLVVNTTRFDTNDAARLIIAAFQAKTSRATPEKRG